MAAIRLALLVWFPALALLLFPQLSHAQGLRCTDTNTVYADVAAIDQAWVWNRYGAIQPHGMMFALMRDIWIVENGQLVDPERAQRKREPGKVALREDKRPRPLVLRVNKGDCLEIRFTNLLDPSRQPWESSKFLTARPEHELCPPQPNPAIDGRSCASGHQPTDRMAGLHVTGLAPDRTITDMAQHVGGNSSSLVAPGASTVYRLIAEEEGTFFAYSPAVTVGSDGNGGAIHAGLFAAVTVEPKGSVWYRSQVTEREMQTAVQGQTSTGHPRLNDYSSLGILKGREIVHSDLNAVIDLRKAELPAGFMCLDEDGKPLAVCGDRKQSFREFTVIFQDESGAVQAFTEFDAPEGAPPAAQALARSLHGVRDGFAINYGTSGAGAEVLANRKGLGPVKNCKECQMEEFFLSSWVVGDPAMIVDKPANMQAPGQAFAGQAASRVYFPDDPSNVYHSYLNDRVVIRNLHAGPKEHHVFHLHAHQWLQTQANPRSPYLDSQTIGPGGAYSYEIAYGGSGNRNKTAGDSIFHCHFYPHFAQGMWALWRVHDTFEAGTVLDEKGRPVEGARALPDGEIETGTPIPALVPLPDVPMAPLPGKVVIAKGQIDSVSGDYPGYPFYYPAKAGNRPPPAPMDITHTGGLDRHIVVDGTIIDRIGDAPANLVKDYDKLKVAYLPENGTLLELAAMQFHRQPFYNTTLPSGAAARFLINGRKEQHGAPFADPCRPADGWSGSTRKFQISAFQYDMVLNKKGWHFPQARILSLNEDVEPTLDGTRLPQPLFFRVASGDCVEVEHTNVVPKKMVRDAFQLQVPTDIIGQHIHLVKFDVQASDGGANGFNYEDGTPAAQEVVARIKAIRKYNSCDPGVIDPAVLEQRAMRLPGDMRTATDQCPIAEPHPWYPSRSEWIGGQITMQRWFADPQEAAPRGGGKTFDKTLETVFTHDHFGASNHQQVGLYAGLIVEPKGSRWFDDVKGNGQLVELGTRADGGPTSWKSMVLSADSKQNFREFALEFQDFQLAYSQKDRFVRQPDGSLIPVNGLNMPHQVADAASGDYSGTSLPKLVKHEWMGGGGCGPVPVPCAPEIVSSDDVGVMSINYRSEPLPTRLASASGAAPAAGMSGDLAHAFRSIPRSDTSLNQAISSYPLVGGVSRPSWPVPSPGMKANDPFTPMLEMMEREPFRIRLLAGAHEHEHSFTINGLTWLNAPHEPDSGYRSFVGTALSEHFEFEGALDIPSARAKSGKFKQLDHLYRVGAAIEDVWYGNWGLIRTYRAEARPDWLPTLETAAQFASGNVRAGALEAAVNAKRQAVSSQPP